MRRGRGRLRWGLLAAGVLGLVGPTAAQGPQYGVPNALVRPAGAPASARIDPAHLDEMEVELAWLTDPALFSYQLVARASGSRLEAHGYVPNQATREKALAVARTRTRRQVVDALKIYPSLAPRSGGEPAEAVQRMAGAVLAEDFAAEPASFKITVRKDGRVTVAGSVRTLEDKWNVSRSLRRVRGCTSVDNRLELAGAEHPQAAPPPPATAAPRAKPPAVVRTLAVPRTPPAPPPVAAAPPPAFAAGPASGSAAPAQPMKGVLAALPPGTPLYLLPTPDASPPMEVAVRDRHSSAVPDTPRPAIAVPLSAEERRALAEAERQAGGTHFEGGGVVAVKYEEPPTPRLPAPKTAARPEKAVTARPASSPASIAGGRVTTGTILITDDRPVARAEKPRVPHEAARPAKLAGGYVTTGAILISEDRPAAAVMVPARDAAAHVQQRIRAACGRAARDVVVVAHSANSLEVRFTAHSQAEADQLSAKMLVIPELLKYQLSFQVRIQP